MWVSTIGAAAVYWWQWNVTVCLYTMMYLGQGVQQRCPGWAHSIDDLYDTDKGAMKAEGQAGLELPRNFGYKSPDFCM